MSEYTALNLKDLDKAGAGFGLPEDKFELRMGRVPLGTEICGVSYERLAPGWRLPFGHAHSEQEEVYVLVNGSARLKIEDEIVEMTSWSAVRVAPTARHSLEGGPNGAELITIGAPNPGHDDAELLMDWWSD